MPNELPLNLLISWALFFAFFNVHMKHSSNFQGASQKMEVALMLSTLLGSLTFFGLLIYYFLNVSWYWPFVIFIFGGFVGVTVTKIFLSICNAIQEVILNDNEDDPSIGFLALTFISFLGWPLSSYWVFTVIDGIQT